MGNGQINLSETHTIDISIIIVTWNSCVEVRQCLDSILRSTGIQILPHHFSQARSSPNAFIPKSILDRKLLIEVVVIDSGSKDQIADLLNEYPDIGFKLLDQNLGFSVCSNLGASYSRGKYFFFLNPDTVLEQNSLSLLFKEAISNKQIGILAPILVNSDYRISELPLKYPNLLSVLSDLPIFKKFIPMRYRTSFSIYDNFSVPIETDWVLGAALLIKSEVFELVGRFDETFFLFSEDIDLCYRVKEANFQILYSPITKIIHSGGATTSKVNYIRETILWESTFLYFKKHKGRRYSLASRILVFGAYFFEYLKCWFQIYLYKFEEQADRRHLCTLALKTAIGQRVIRP